MYPLSGSLRISFSRLNIKQPAKLWIYLLCGVIVLVLWISTGDKLYSDLGEDAIWNGRNTPKFWGNTILMVVGGVGGNFPLFLTLLCMKLQDTASMSVPRGKPNKFKSLFKEDTLHKRQLKKSSGNKRKSIKPPKNAKLHKRKGKEKYFSSESLAYEDYGKSNDILFPILPQTGNIYSSDMSSLGLKDENHVDSILNSMYKNLEKLKKDSTSRLRDMRKYTRHGKNVNELESLLLLSSLGSSESEGSSSDSKMRNGFMNTNKDEALRLKILQRVNELDPLMCLPKVLCGYTSRQKRQKDYSSRLKPKTSIKTTRRPTFQDSLLQDYLHLIDLMGPTKPPKESKSKTTQKPGQKKTTKRVGKQTKKKGESDEQDDDGQSGSSSSESEEDDEPYYKHYPISTQQSHPDISYHPYYYGHHHPATKTTEETHPAYTNPYYYDKHYYPISSTQQSRPMKQDMKFLFNKDKSEEDDGHDNDSDGNDGDGDDDDDKVQDDLDNVATEDGIISDDLVNDSHMEYLVDRERMNKLITSTGPYSDENWWQPFEEEHYDTLYKYPEILPSREISPIFSEPIQDDENTSSNPGMMSMISKFFSRMMPSFISLGGSTNEEFQNDPFFSFDRRSINRREGRSFTNKTVISTTTTPKQIKQVKKEKSGRALKLGDLFGVDIGRGQLDSRPWDYGAQDPAEKFRIAVEIGKRMADPSQCDHIYNGCPLTYEEILAVINEPSKEEREAKTTTSKPKSKTKGSGSSSVSVTYSSSPTLSYPARPHVLTFAPPQVITLPYYGTSPSSPQQNIPYPQHPSHQHYQILPHLNHNPQQQTYLYNQKFQHQQQQQQLQYIQENPSQMTFFKQGEAEQLEQKNKLQFDEMLAQKLGMKSTPFTSSGVPTTHNPHKTSIHQDYPTGELQINLLYSEKGQQNPMAFDRAGVTAASFQDVKAVEIPSSNNSDGLPSVSQFILSQQNVPNIPFNEASEIQNMHTNDQTGETWDDEVIKGIIADIGSNEVLKLPTSANVTSSETYFEEDAQIANNRIEHLASSQSFESGSGGISHLVLSKRTTMATKAPYKSKNPVDSFPKKKRKKVKGESTRYDEHLEGTFPLSPYFTSPPPTTTLPPVFPSKKKKIKKRLTYKKKSVRREKMPQQDYKSKGNGKIKSGKKRFKQKSDEDDDNDDGKNSSSRNPNGSGSSDGSNGSISTSNESGNPKRKKGSLGKRGHSKHLHKQSSASIEAKKGVKKGKPSSSSHSNIIFPAYGHPFPPPYGGYYDRPPPPRFPTPTSGSFLSYFFGR